MSPTSAASVAPVRRRLIRAGASAAAGWLGAGCVASPNAATAPARPHASRSPIVLVHGAWYGGWCWRKLTPLLAQAGHTVYAPTLTGLGERAHLGSARTGVRDHVQDVVALLDMEDLREVTLVGHSYAGMLIGAVAARSRERVRQLIYLDAFVPEAGKRVVDYLLPFDRRQAIVQAGEANGFIAPIPPQALGVTDAVDVAWITPRTMRQPYASFSEPATDVPPADVPRAYVACTQPASGSFGQFAQRLRNDKTWRYTELATGHNAMVTAPQALASVLLAWAG
jgi:pimeloyl-ACP methyl ester carboxylesterase